MTGLLTDKVAIVTGAGQGVGEGIARALADAGAAVVIAARRAENGEPAAAALRKRGHEASFVRCDVSVEADVAAQRSELSARKDSLLVELGELSESLEALYVSHANLRATREGLADGVRDALGGAAEEVLRRVEPPD